MYIIQFILLTAISICKLVVEARSNNRSFVINYIENCFQKDRYCFQYVSGSLHYFRVPKIYWNDRLEKATSLGLNTIQTYVPWNYHETSIGHYDFEEEKDIQHFLNLAQQNDLAVILRIGPYIDAEWEHGGIPWWLGKFDDIKIRTSDSRYMNFVEKWWTILAAHIKPFLYKNGGPVIAFQIENEYGNFYACDKNYMKELRDLTVNLLGGDIVLFTTDGYTDDYLNCGTIPSIYKTIDFGTEIAPEKAFHQQRKYQPSGPLVNSEYYTGWLDYWGSKHQTRDASLISTHLLRILQTDFASVNLYMFHGGSNFGWMNGADMEKENFLASPTSYDYDAPLSESGDSTFKYFQIRKTISNYFMKELPPIPKNSTKKSYGEVLIVPKFNLFDIISSRSVTKYVKRMLYPQTMEKMDFPYGFVVYEASIPKLKEENMLVEGKIHDRFIIFIDEKVVYIGKRGRISKELKVGSKITIFIENQGRVAYADKGKQYLPDRKGIIGNITINNIILTNWISFHINEDAIANTKVKHTQETKWGPLVYEGVFKIEQAEDTFLDMAGWGKGQILINQHNLGRFWSSIGPQRTLFVPRNLLKKGKNSIRIFETEFFQFIKRTVKFIDFPILQV